MKLKTKSAIQQKKKHKIFNVITKSATNKNASTLQGDLLMVLFSNNQQKLSNLQGDILIFGLA